MKNAKNNPMQLPRAAILRGFLIVFVSLATLCPDLVHAIGLRIPNQDPAAIARGNAFAATADNPSAIYYNPAGITQLPGNNIQIGVLSYLGLNVEYKSPTGSKSETDFEVLSAPQLYYTYTPEEIPLSFGLGVYTPFGLGVEWPQDTGFRSLAIESRLQYLTLNPIIAWKIIPSLSIAAGPTINYGKLEIRRGLATPTDMLHFDGDGVSCGFNAGILWQPHQQWSFGLNYRSASTMDFDGSTSYNPGFKIPSADTTATAEFPQVVSGGVSYRPTPKWNIEVDVDWTDWSTINTLTLKGTKNLGFPVDLPFQLNWHDSWLFELGATYYFDNGWFISAGYFYSTDTTSEKYYTPAVPDTALHVGSVGFGYKGEHWRWAFATQLATAAPRDINNSQPNPFTGQSADGSYQMFVPTVSMSIGYQF